MGLLLCAATVPHSGENPIENHKFFDRNDFLKNRFILQKKIPLKTPLKASLAPPPLPQNKVLRISVQISLAFQKWEKNLKKFYYIVLKVFVQIFKIRRKK